uniref:Uncharacterized protein n=1 Tax=Manihot esculenta TaxID=3983 RepID=A0A2C9U3R8_MANES
MAIEIGVYYSGRGAAPRTSVACLREDRVNSKRREKRRWVLLRLYFGVYTAATRGRESGRRQYFERKCVVN